MNDPSPLEAIFFAALEKGSPQERAACLDEACAGEPELRRRVEKMLAAQAQAGSFLEHPAPSPDATVDEQPAREGPSTVIGPYKLLEQIGEGGFGVVFLAEQTQPVRRKVALKVLKAGLGSREVVARFEAERQALALMDHPNIARVLDGGETPSGRPYFVMELVRGVPITHFCDSNHLTPRQRLELFVTVCHAVQHAHQKGIIHRDIKPFNVLVSMQDRPVAKVIDFGVAKALGHDLTDKTVVTGFAQMIGTPLYMSPEQAGQSGLDVDTRSDIYSLGVLLYELLTSTTPFRKERFRQVTIEEVRRIIREEEPPRPSTRLSESRDTLASIAASRQTEPARLAKLLRGDLDWIVMKALEKDRNRRYDSASALAADVLRYLHDEPVLACPPSAGYRLRKFARRNKGGLAVAAGLVLAVVVMAASIGWSVRDRLARAAAGEVAESARRAEVVRQVRDSLNAARALVADNKLASGRQKLAQARAALGTDETVLADLAAEVAAGEVGLDRFEQYLDLIERAHQAETAPLLDAPLVADPSHGKVTSKPLARTGDRRPAAAVPFLLEALRRYGILDREDWTSTLAGGFLGKHQVEQIRRLAYAELLWLADDVVRRRQDHRSGRTLSRQRAARAALVYLGKAEGGHRPTPALHSLRARCHATLGEAGAAVAAARRAARTPPSMALDHYLQGQAAYDAKEKAKGVRAFEAALRLEPTHYWSLMKLGNCLSDLAGRREDFAEAVRVFTGCILKRPDHAHAYYCRARASAQLSRDEETVADYSRAIALDPGYAEAWYGRGLAHNRFGRPRKALADHSRALALDPTLARAWLSRGFTYHRMGRLPQALADYSRAIEVDPGLALAWNNRGAAYTNLGKPKKALAEYSRAIELDPELLPAWFNRGDLYYKLDRPDKAVVDFGKVIELDPKSAVAWSNRGAAYTNLGRPDRAVADCSKAIELDPKLALAWSNRGNAHLELGRPDKSLADCSKAVELDPKFALAWNNRGNALLRLGRPDRAIADYCKAIELEPKLVLAWRNRGAAFIHWGKLNRAIADFTKVIELQPKSAAGWGLRGNAYIRWGKPGRAVADCSKAIELDPADASAWMNRGAAYTALSRPKEALADFSKAITLSPKFGLAWINRGSVQAGLSRYEKAVADLSKGIELVPDHPLALRGLMIRGLSHSRLGKFAKAREDYRAVLKRVPNHSAAHNALAWLLATCPDAKLRDPKAALESAKKAVELEPKQGVCWKTLGVASYRAGDWKAAVAALEKGMALLGSWDGVDRFFLAMAHRKLGNREKARKAYEQAVGWEEKHKDDLKKVGWFAEQLRRFRAEAEEVLELKKK
jgi:tetratricopeptide (TPR) repeat protein